MRRRFWKCYGEMQSVRVTLPSIGREERPLTTGNIIPVFLGERTCRDCTEETKRHIYGTEANRPRSRPHPAGRRQACVERPDESARHEKAGSVRRLLPLHFKHRRAPTAVHQQPFDLCRRVRWLLAAEAGAVLSRPTILVRGRHRRRDRFRTQHAGMDHHRDIIRIQRPVLRTADPFDRARSGAGIDVSCGAWIRCDPYS